jgi:hypothetical protein
VAYCTVTVNRSINMASDPSLIPHPNREKVVKKEKE